MEGENSGMIAVVDKLTGETLRVYLNAIDASVGEGATAATIRRQARERSLGRDWTMFRYAEDMGRKERLHGKLNCPCVCYDENIAVAFKSANAAATALGMGYSVLRWHIEHGEPFKFDGLDVIAVVPEFASKAYGKTRRYE